MELVTVLHRSIQNAGQESDRVDNQHISLPATDRMARTARLDVDGVVGHVHINRTLQSELPIFEKDRVLVLCDAVDRTIERPIEDDAGCLAAEARIVLPRKFRGRLLSKLR